MKMLNDYIIPLIIAGLLITATISALPKRKPVKVKAKEIIAEPTPTPDYGAEWGEEFKREMKDIREFETK